MRTLLRALCRGLVAISLSAVPVRASGDDSVERGETASLSGVVRASDGTPVSDARISVSTVQGAILAAIRSDAGGSFRLERLPPCSCLLRAEAPGFAPRRLAVQIGPSAAPLDVEVLLLPESFHDEVTVTASLGRAEALDRTPQAVNVIGEERVALRAKSVLAQAVSEEQGLHVQRTSPTLAGVFVRGLTGAKVNVYVDGVRYTTSAQRGGISTFFDLVEPEAVESVEILRGPSSAEYGSDALGGSVQLLTRGPAFSAEGGRLSGSWSTSFGTADTSYGSGLTTAWAGRRLGLSTTLAGRRVNTLRPGGGVDSHSAVTRFLGLPSSAVVDGRLPDTAFTQYGGRLRVNWAISPTAQLAAGYLRGQQDGGRRYDQLLGGDGNLVAELKNLMVDHAWVRLEKQRAGWLDRIALTWSFGAQREERVNQGGNGDPRADLNHEPERTVVHGAQASAHRRLGGHDLAVGGDVYFEGLKARSFAVMATTGAVTPRRGRVPDGARYRHGGIFLQDVVEAVPGRLRFALAARWSAASYEAEAADSPLVAGEPLWPDDSYDTSALTFRAGAVGQVAGGLAVAANVSRGFRAPDVTDLGTFGLTGSGYEVSNREVEGLGAMVGTTADSTAVSSGEAVRGLDPETSLSCELGLRWRSRRLRADLTVFQTDLDGNVAKQSLVLPPGALGTRLAGEPVVRQLDSGVVFVAAASNPVLVRANFDEARLRGVEGGFEVPLAASLSIAGSFTAIRAEDRRTGRPPNVEGGTPAPDAWLRARLAPAGGKGFWLEAYLHAAARQSRLSTLDLEDRRTGATRSRATIARFFDNGARVRDLVGPGPDGAPGTADDVLLATGETLAEVLDRVLGPDGTPRPLFDAVPGYAVFGVRGAIRFGTRHEILFDLENLGDVSYRGVSWGIDAPGRGVFVRYVARF